MKKLFLALIHVSNCYKTQKMYEKSAGTCTFMLEFVPNCCKTQEVCEKAVSKKPFMLKYCLVFLNEDIYSLY